MTTTTLNASQTSEIASYSSLLSSIAKASQSISSAVASIDGTASDHKPAIYKVIGIVLAIASGLFIGSSFVFKKKGLLSSQKHIDPSKIGDSHAYLKSPMWWTGMIIMVIGEICNFVAYAFADAILITPMGALSVVICAILSSFFLKERLSLFGKIGCFLCIVGATTIAVNAPQEGSVSTITEFEKLFLAPGFLVYGSVVILCSLILIFFVAPKYGKKNMLVYISVCSLIGGLSVSCTQGLGSAIVTSIGGNNQFKHWFIYFLLVFVIVTLLTEINYLNKALELFNTALVTPTYYVLFTFCTLVTSVILYQGFNASATGIITIVLGFLTICCGITLLQMSKIDPEQLQKQVGLDRRTTILLAATRADVEPSEKHTEEEDPGMDSIRGSAGIIGSIIRAKSARRSMVGAGDPRQRRWTSQGRGNELDGLQRTQLYDRPVPLPEDALEQISLHSGPKSPVDFVPDKERAIGFAGQVTAHRYPLPGKDARPATHEQDLEANHGHHHHAPGHTDAFASMVTYTDPYAAADASEEDGHRLHPYGYPQSATLSRQSSGGNDSFNKRLDGFRSTPDLSLQDPRASTQAHVGVGQRLRNMLHSPSIGSRGTRSRSRDRRDYDDIEHQGLVNSLGKEQERHSLDEVSSLESDSDEDLDEKDNGHGPL